MMYPYIWSKVLDNNFLLHRRNAANLQMKSKKKITQRLIYSIHYLGNVIINTLRMRIVRNERNLITPNV